MIRPRRASAIYREADVSDVQGRTVGGRETGMRKRGMRRRGRQHAALKGRLLDGDVAGGAGSRPCVLG